MSKKPLFIPLKRQYFEAFERGEKIAEYRKHGPRWNRETCQPGRPVTLSLGYGKARRLYGYVCGFRKLDNTKAIDGWRDCYGDYIGPAARIEIKLDRTSP